MFQSQMIFWKQDTLIMYEKQLLSETWTLQEHSLGSVVGVDNLRCKLLRLDKNHIPTDSTYYKNNLTVDMAVIYDIFYKNMT